MTVEHNLGGHGGGRRRPPQLDARVIVRNNTGELDPPEARQQSVGERLTFSARLTLEILPSRCSFSRNPEIDPV
jgi:hypothetical protein